MAPKREPRERVTTRQCNVELPAAIDDALRAHLSITHVPKRDFVLLAVRREVARQRLEGLGLVHGRVPPGGEGIE